MVKKKQKINYWKWGFIGLIGFLTLLAFFYSLPSSEEVNSTWEQHRNILKNDVEKFVIITENHCEEGTLLKNYPSCINFAYPRLEAYAQHIVNAKNFMINEGSVFTNQQELLWWLDEQSVAVQTEANVLDSIIKEYNNWVVNQQQVQTQNQIRQEVLVDILKILALGV